MSRTVAAVVAVATLAVLAAGACSGAEGGTRADRATPAAPATGATGTSADPATTTTTRPATTTTTAPCPPVDGVGGDVTVFRARAGGGCVPAGRLVAYRCDDGSVPVVVTGMAATPTDHLGGRFAATVPSAPADAALLGVRPDGGRVLRSPTDPDAVYLDTGAAVTRWPAVRHWPTASGAVVDGFYRPAAFFLGDSVMLGAVDAIRAAMAPWDVVVDAAVSRSTIAGAEVVRQRRAEIHDVVVVQLGTNDGADPGLYAERVRAVMAELAGVPLVVWLTIREARPYYTTTNATLRDVLRAYPNATVADWNAVAPPSAVYSDGLHLRAEGAAAMAALARDTVMGWYAATVDRGPDACRPALEAAVRARG
jgi:lysophospholipase L1-like esterase